MDKEIVKVCKIHGELTIDKVGRYRNKIYKNGKRPFHYNCKICRTNKRKGKPRKIDVSEEYRKINILYENLTYCYCKNSKKINGFNNYQLKNRYSKCKLCESALNRKYYVLNVYKLNAEQYEKLLKEQNYVCKICGQNETAKLKRITKRLSVDHCHASEKNGVLKIRGLLCYTCNQGLFAFKDNPDYLKKAIEYLEMQAL